MHMHSWSRAWKRGAAAAALLFLGAIGGCASLDGVTGAPPDGGGADGGGDDAATGTPVPPGPSAADGGGPSPHDDGGPLDAAGDDGGPDACVASWCGCGECQAKDIVCTTKPQPCPLECAGSCALLATTVCTCAATD